MASKSPEDKLEFLLNVLATCDEFKPNYGKLKDKMKINTNANAQRQFKSIVESGKHFTLDSTNGQTRVVDNSGGSTTATKTTTNKARKRTKKESDDVDEEEIPPKKAKKSKAKTAAAESENEE